MTQVQHSGLGSELLAEMERRVPLETLVDQPTRDLIQGRRTGAIRRRGWMMRRALLAADAVSLLVAFTLAQLLFGGETTQLDRLSTVEEVLLFAVTLPVWLLIARILGLYSHDEERPDHRTVDDSGRVIVVVTLGSWCLLVLSSLTHAADPYMPKLLTFWVVAVVLMSATRAIARTFVRRSLAYTQNAVIVGAGEIGQLVASKILRHPEYGINLLGFVDDELTTRREDIRDLPMLGTVDELAFIMRELDVERVVVAFSGVDPDRLMTDLRRLRHDDVQIDIVPRLFDIVGPGVEVHAVEGVSLIGLSPVRLSLGSRAVKRSFDLCGSLIGLVLLAPLLLFIAVRIKLNSPGPVFFKQRRPGRSGVLFRVVKFRTMHVAGPGLDAAPQLSAQLAHEYSVKHKLDDDPRVTSFGRWLRHTSLDELPQLWNVLRGEMSLVGPRPMLIDELGRPDDVTTEILMVKPGMTGYWQVNGRSDTDYDDRQRLDLSYVAGWSIGLDLAILARTLRVIVSGQGAA